MDDLRKLAEAVPASKGWFVLTLASGADVRARHASGGSTWVAMCRTNEDADYFNACHPAKIIAMVDALEKAKALLDAVHAGRMVPLDAASVGYVASVVNAAEEALAALEHKATP